MKKDQTLIRSAQYHSLLVSSALADRTLLSDTGTDGCVPILIHDQIQSTVITDLDWT